MTAIALAQLSSDIDKTANLKKACAWIAEATALGAEVIVFPEFLMAYSPATQSAAELAAMAEPIDGPFVSALADAAKTHHIAVVASLYETCARAERVYDTAVWIDGMGDVAAVYRKLHLYDAFGFKESDKFQAGTTLAPVVDQGQGRYGLMICYDLRFPEMGRMLTLEGANVLMTPSGWVQGELKVDHWRTMIQARALENGCYIIAPDQVGQIYIGHSLIVDPLGRILVDLGETEGMRVIRLDWELVKETRAKLPLLQNRRTDVYGRSRLLR